MGSYDSSMVRGGSDFKVDIMRHYRGEIREYFKESKAFLWNPEEFVTCNAQGSKFIPSLFELDTNASQVCYYTQIDVPKYLKSISGFMLIIYTYTHGLH